VRYNVASGQGQGRNLKLCTVALSLQLRAGCRHGAKHVRMRKPCLIFSMRLQYEQCVVHELYFGWTQTLFLSPVTIRTGRQISV